MKKNIQSDQNPVRPPVVVIVGHVDHGKTTLLDRIRESDIAGREHGGITQHIGAYQITLSSGKDEKKDTTPFKITFIDTPGHEAFSKMRSRGAGVADIAILVVAADDSVKPQTVEAAQHIQKAGIPIIVAVNKIDLPAANIEKVKSDLAKIGIQVEGFGGQIPIIPISAKSGTGIGDLLEMIKLVYSLQDTKPENPTAIGALVIETKMDKGRGIIASVLVKSGILKTGDEVYLNQKKIGKVKALTNDKGNNVREAETGTPVEVMGLSEYPEVGSVLTTIPASSAQANTAIYGSVSVKKSSDEMPDYLKPVGEIEAKINILLKADTAGTLEAIIAALPTQISIISTGIGEVNEKDIFLAKSSKAIIIGFNIGIHPTALKAAQAERVIFRNYKLIYELIDDLTEVAGNAKELSLTERELGKAEVIAQFPYNQMLVAGTKVVSGRLSRGDTIKIIRGETEVARARIKSMRQGKLEINKTEAGHECGLLFDHNIDFKLNDVIIAITHL